MITRNRISTVSTLAVVAMAALTIGQVPAEPINVPNGEFIMYKPGTNYTVTATFPAGGNSYAQGVGDNLTVIGDGIVNYSDGSSGAVVDCPGWTELTGRNDLFNNGMDGSTGYNAFGTWSGGTGTTAESDSLGNIVGGGTYTLSAMINGSAGPLVFDLLAGGVALTPSSAITPTLPTGGWQVISRTYDAGAVAGYIGQSMTIVLGTGAENLVGTRVVFDNVTLDGPVSPALQVTLEPAALAYVAEGSAFVTTATASGATTYTMSWTFEPASAPGTTDTVVGTIVDSTDNGSSVSVLTIDPVTADREGTYTIVAEGGGTSASASLILRLVPALGVKRWTILE